MSRTVLAFSCPHSPYHHLDAIDFIADQKRRHKPDIVVCLGDEADMYRLSSHEQDPDALSIEQELTGVRQFITDLGKISPKLKLCQSNHVRRLTKAAAKAGLPLSALKDWAAIIEAPRSWEWRREWCIDDVNYFHADGYSGTNAIYQAISDYRTNVVFGHLHTLGRVEYHATRHWSAWGASAGCLITTDDDSPARRHGKYHRRKPIRGAILVADRVPTYLPMKG